MVPASQLRRQCVPPSGAANENCVDYVTVELWMGIVESAHGHCDEPEAGDAMKRVVDFFEERGARVGCPPRRDGAGLVRGKSVARVNSGSLRSARTDTDRRAVR